MVKQNVSAPIAVALIALGLLLLGLALIRTKPASEVEPPSKPLPWSPPVEQAELDNLRKGLLPLGVRAVFPPLTQDRMQGVRIAMVMLDSPAARAGIQPGDLIKKFDQWDLPQPYALVAALTQVKPQQEYKVVVVRAGKEQTLTVTGLTPLPPEERVK